jgi:hypothetical protein
MASLFFLVCVYSLLTAVRVPLYVHAVPGTSLAKTVVAAGVAGISVSVAFGEGVRHMRHASALWQQAPRLAIVNAGALYCIASAATACVALLP